MKKIKIILGGYGHRRNPEGPVELITSKNGAIDVSDQEAERLVAAGIAEYAEEDKAESEGVVTVSELRKRAKELGLSTSGSKQELIDKIAAAEKALEEPEGQNPNKEPENPNSDEDDEEPPVLTPVDPE